MPILMLVALNTTSHQMLGVTTSTIQFMRSVGATLGVALMGSLLNGRLQSELVSQTPPEVTQNVPTSLLQPLQDPEILRDPSTMQKVHEAFLALGSQGEQLFQAALTATKTALAMGITYAFLVGTAITVGALVVGIFLKEVPLRRDSRYRRGGGAIPRRRGRSGATQGHCAEGRARSRPVVDRRRRGLRLRRSGGPRSPAEP